LWPTYKVDSVSSHTKKLKLTSISFLSIFPDSYFIQKARPVCVCKAVEMAWERNLFCVKFRNGRRKQLIIMKLDEVK
jgi:hypothetical protein